MEVSDSNWNKATLSGCTDIIVVDQKDGGLASTPFNVRFGKFKVLRTKKKTVKITVNGVEANFIMRLTRDGTGIFEELRESILQEEEDDSEFDLYNYEEPILEISKTTIDTASKSSSTKNEKSEELKIEKSESQESKSDKSQNQKSPTISGKKGESESDWEDDQTGEVGISLCANKLVGKKEEDEKIFNKHKVNFKTYSKKPADILNNTNLIVKYKGEYYTWENASQILLSNLVYKKELPEELRAKILKKQTKKGFFSSWFGFGGDKKVQPEPTRDNDAAPDAADSYELVHTVTPTSEMLKSLNLKYGQNTIEYSVKSKLRGTQTLKASIFYYRPDIKIIVSDVDGTITKSDVRGQLLPMIGMDWSQPGITELYSAASKNGYVILYLTARSMGQNNSVRSYISKLNQDNAALPVGPIMTSSDRLAKAFKREILERQPHIFKIAFLQEVRNLFPADKNPFYSGFGNRLTDRMAYEGVEMAKDKIFIVNPKSEITNEAGEKSSYSEMAKNIDLFFPKIEEKLNRTKPVGDMFGFPS